VRELHNSNNNIAEVCSDADHSHRDRLIIVGSGNVAHNVYRIAAILGYSISVIDSRAETLTRERFPEAGELLLGDIVELLNTCEINENTSIVLLSHHHEFDEVALQAVIRSPARYIGIMGNKHKVTAYFRQLHLWEIPEDLIKKVHVPIGLDLGGQRAAEIALSAMAEIQAVKYGRSGGFVVLQREVKGRVERDELF
jgi:xanthine dehydrogenase accessory factor